MMFFSPFYHFLNENHPEAEDTYGCGINESFPCKTEEWMNIHDLPGVNDIIVDLDIYTSHTIYVGEGTDWKRCGLSSSPCSSLSYSFFSF
jgi:hypothetical protein